MAVGAVTVRCYADGMAKVPRVVAVTVFVRSLIRERNQAGQSFQKIGDEFGVTKTHVLNVHNKGFTVGTDVEEKVAKLLFGGSVDELRRRAQEFAQANPHLIPPEPPPDDPLPLRRELRSLSVWRDTDPQVRDYLLSDRYGADLGSIDQWLAELRNAERRVARGEKLQALRSGEEDLNEPDPEDAS